MSDREELVEKVATNLKEEDSSDINWSLDSYYEQAEGLVTLIEQSRWISVESKIMQYSQWSGDMGEEVIAVRYLQPPTEDR